jgi:hypothetical protein
MSSGSHIMSFVLAKEQNWSTSSTLTPVVLGPFPALRDGVTGVDPANPQSPPSRSADFFMWEQFTTKPYLYSSPSSPSPPLKKIGEIFTPWPSWHIAASTSSFPSPANDPRLSQLFGALDRGIAAFEADTERVVKLLGTGELGCTYAEDDAREWLKDVKFVKGGTKGVDRCIVEGAVEILKEAGVVSRDLRGDEAVKAIAGILRSES